MTARGIQLPQDLMDLRKAKGLSLLQIAAVTKISVRYLEAIERGAFQELPGSLYTESYIRQYARAVDDADNALLEYYRNAFVPQTVRQITEPKPQSRMDRFRDVVGSAFGVTRDSGLSARKRRVA